jgi:integrase
LGLGWDDCGLEAGTLRVHRQPQRLDGENRLVELKTEKSRRTLALPAVAVEALRAHRARQNEARLLLGPRWQDSGRVFTTITGGYLSGSSVTHRYQARLNEAGLPQRSFHELRHGAASLLLARGTSMRTVMEQLGHSQITLTMNTCAHIAPELLRDAADKLNAALGGV